MTQWPFNGPEVDVIAATARDQALDRADECNQHRAMLRNCLQWMDQAAIASMLEANGWIESHPEPRTE